MFKAQNGVVTIFLFRFLVEANASQIGDDHRPFVNGVSEVNASEYAGYSTVTCIVFLCISIAVSVFKLQYLFRNNCHFTEQVTFFWLS